MRAIYIEAFSGLSGDMFLGALAGLSGNFDLLKELPAKLNLPDAKVEIYDVVKNGIACKHVKVVDLKSNNGHDNPGRHLTDIFEIIEKASITSAAKKIAKEIFLIIGKAESKIHNIPLEKIHFHEISGVDSIVDIVGAAVLIDELNITEALSTPVCTGKGFVKTAHGKLPVPAPATLEILSGIPFYKGDEEGEKVTPTGAAILKYLNPRFDEKPLVIEKTAYGPGEKDFDVPNVLRISLLKNDNKSASGKKLFILETNIDDMNNELLGADFQEGLQGAGAVDFHFTNVMMKKGRPGILISCLVKERDIDAVSNYLLDNTSTIGVRYYPVNRKTLDREIKSVETKYGTVEIKIVNAPSGKRFSVEYESLMRIGKKTGIPAVLLEKEIIKEIKI